MNNKQQQKNLEIRKQKEENLQRKAKQLKKEKKANKGTEGKGSSSFLELFKREKKRYTIEDTLVYKKMYNDGICYVGDNIYNKMVEYQDINYQLAKKEDKDVIFNQFAGFLNTFDETTELQLSFVNQIGRDKEIEEAITIAPKNDGFNEIRKEFREMLQNQLAKGNNGLKKSKYIVFTAQGESYQQAKPILERIELDVLQNLKSMGVRAEVLNGMERLKIMHDMMNPDKLFPYDKEECEKCDTRSLVMPENFKFNSPNYMQMGNYLCSLSHFQILASELSDRLLSEILAIEDNMYVSFHIHAMDQTDAIKMIKRKNTDLQKMIIEEQTKAVRAGYDMGATRSLTTTNIVGNKAYTKLNLYIELIF